MPGADNRAGPDCDAEALWLRGTKARAQLAKRVAHPDNEQGNKKKRSVTRDGSD